MNELAKNEPGISARVFLGGGQKWMPDPPPPRHKKSFCSQIFLHQQISRPETYYCDASRVTALVEITITYYNEKKPRRGYQGRRRLQYEAGLITSTANKLSERYAIEKLIIVDGHPSLLRRQGPALSSFLMLNGI